ncbi:aspartate aminotransferase family protein [Candidatus Bathyarchaeota archaeon]|nr:aspartate aminotransferase family protein [Candidatus Bathyarchaeota archaeon]
MNKEEIILAEQKFMAKVYAKKPLILVKGKGDLVWDINGKQYIDCSGSYGAAVIGYCHPKVIEAIKNQVENLTSCHGFAYNEARSMLLEKLAKLFPEGFKFFLSNSGTEAVECALKLARKFTGKMEIIAMKGGYHGKTLGALSATWNKKYRNNFEPLLKSVKHVPYGDSEAIKNSITEETAAVIVEPIQGESGVKVPPKEFLKELREICYEKNIILILDEIQTGFGRTGKIFCFQHYDITPDIICLAKGLAGGLPIGVTAAKSEIMDVFQVGEHTSTYGGNPIVSAAACAAIDVLLEENLPEKAWNSGNYFINKLKEIALKHKILRDVRGLGLMIGVEFRFEVYDLLLNLINKGVLALDAGRTVLRFLPPLVISKEHINQVVKVLNEVVEEKESLLA